MVVVVTFMCLCVCMCECARGSPDAPLCAQILLPPATALSWQVRWRERGVLRSSVGAHWLVPCACACGAQSTALLAAVAVELFYITVFGVAPALLAVGRCTRAVRSEVRGHNDNEMPLVVSEFGASEW